eukprot:1472570-Prymnesium_polylepis.1
MQLRAPRAAVDRSDGRRCCHRPRLSHVRCAERAPGRPELLHSPPTPDFVRWGVLAGCARACVDGTAALRCIHASTSTTRAVARSLRLYPCAHPCGRHGQRARRPSDGILVDDTARRHRLPDGPPAHVRANPPQSARGGGCGLCSSLPLRAHLRGAPRPQRAQRRATSGGPSVRSVGAAGGRLRLGQRAAVGARPKLSRPILIAGCGRHRGGAPA